MQIIVYRKIGKDIEAARIQDTQWSAFAETIETLVSEQHTDADREDAVLNWCDNDGREDETTWMRPPFDDAQMIEAETMLLSCAL